MFSPKYILKHEETSSKRLSDLIKAESTVDSENLDKFYSYSTLDSKVAQEMKEKIIKIK